MRPLDGPVPAKPADPADQSKAFSTFAAQRGPELIGLAYTLCGDREAARDIVQSVMVRLAARDLSEVLDLAAYARRAVYNETASLGRTWSRNISRRQRLAAEWERTLRVQPDPHDRFEVMSALAGLPHRQRAAVVLRYYLDLTDQEIADVLGCATATVRTLLARALRRLRTELEDLS